MTQRHHKLNGIWTAFIWGKVLYNNTCQHSHACLQTDGRGCHARCQPAHHERYSVPSKTPHDDSMLTHTPHGKAIRSNLGFSILLKDTSTFRLEESGIKPPIFRLVNYHKHNRHDKSPRQRLLHQIYCTC